MATITPKVKTYLKTHPWQIAASKDKPEFKAFPCPVLSADGSKKTLAVDPVGISQDIDGHAAIVFNPPLTVGGVKYPKLFVYMKDWDGLDVLIKNKVAASSSLSPAGSTIVQRKCTHYAQSNNTDWADDNSASSLRYGGVQCGLTSLAIALSEPGILTADQHKTILSGSPTGKFDDGVAAIFKKIGAQSISMEGHAAVLKHLGIDSVCTRSATLSELKEHIEKYSIAVLGTIYGGSGHFVAASGFDMVNNRVLLKDPFGIRNKQSTDQWALKFANESEVRDDWWGADLMGDLWAKVGDGWCVLPKPKQTIVLNSTPAPEVIQASPEVVQGESITILETTWLKRTIASAKDLAAADKVLANKGETIACQVIGAKASHGQIKKPDGSVWWIYSPHFSGQEAKSGQNASNAGRDFPVDEGKLRNAIAQLANPSVPQKEIDDLCTALIAQASKYTITKREHLIHFLAQCLHESGGAMYLEELASGADYDDRDDLGNCRPEAIAAAAKAGTSVGRFYKGHSLIQTTGYDNHLAYGLAAGSDAVNHPEKLAEYPDALGAALFFWSTRGPSLSVDAEGGINEATCVKITKVVNGHTNGLDDRLHYMWELDKLI